MAITDDREPVWDQPIDVPERWIKVVDTNVAVTQNAIGKAMVSGEYESMKALHDALPELTPKPIAWGTFAHDENVHFFLCEFVVMTDDLPDVEASMKMLADLHSKSLSPNGQYGFYVPTLQGTVPQRTEWANSWEEFFTKSIKLVFENEERSQGYDEEVQRLCQETLSKVVPRLLRPLETGGRHIEPRLIHGDIWDGNTSTDVATNLPVIYDATCIYAHNERKLADTSIHSHAELCKWNSHPCVPYVTKWGNSMLKPTSGTSPSRFRKRTRTTVMRSIACQSNHL
ncbi:MAG: hypothetical protein Q9225_005672 [Loekoesia sp. 1 TL-2023]